MKLTIERNYDIIPTVNDNDKDPEPMVFHCKILNTNEREECFHFDTQNVREDGSTAITLDRKRMFELSVTSIENLEVNGQQITTAAQFLKTEGLAAYYDDVTIKMIPYLSAVVSKN